MVVYDACDIIDLHTNIAYLLFVKYIKFCKSNRKERIKILTEFINTLNNTEKKMVDELMNKVEYNTVDDLYKGIVNCISILDENMLAGYKDDVKTVFIQIIALMILVMVEEEHVNIDEIKMTG
ncbi:MAG: hypothetical protein QXK74_08445 [Candidatus Nitrosocaldaceae archaeon]